MKTPILYSSAFAVLLLAHVACGSSSDESYLLLEFDPQTVSANAGTSTWATVYIETDSGLLGMYLTPSSADLFTVDSFEGASGGSSLVNVMDTGAGVEPGEHHYDFEVDQTSNLASGIVTITCKEAGSGTLEFLVNRKDGKAANGGTLSVECAAMPVGFQVTPATVSQTHIYGTSPCPQEIATVTISNNTSDSLDWTFNNNGLAVSSPMSSGTLAAGASVEVVLAFECDPEGVSGVVTFTAGDATADVTVSVIVDGAP